MTDTSATPINLEFLDPLMGGQHAPISNNEYCNQSLQSASSIDELKDHLGILTAAAPQNSQAQKIVNMIDQGHSLQQIKETFGTN